jgi:hypothetical protein
MRHASIRLGFRRIPEIQVVRTYGIVAVMHSCFGEALAVLSLRKTGVLRGVTLFVNLERDSILNTR